MMVLLPHIRLYYHKTVRYTFEAKLLATFTKTVHLLAINNKLLLYQQQRQLNKTNVGAVGWDPHSRSAFTVINVPVNSIRA